MLWWIVWILLTILTFFAGYAFWTPFIARHVGNMDKGATPVLWVSAVFGTWMVLLLPLILTMYHKVDRTYEEARVKRDAVTDKKKAAFSPVKSIFIPEAERLLGDALVKKIKKMPETIKRGHLVTALLKNGQKIEHVFVLDKTEVMGVYGYEKAPFRVSDIVDLQPSPLERIPVFEAGRWLRFDGLQQVLPS